MQLKYARVHFQHNKVFKSEVKNGIILINSNFVATTIILKCVRKFIRENRNVAIGFSYLKQHRKLKLELYRFQMLIQIKM